MSADPPFLHARPDVGAFAITGPDRRSWLNGLVTQDVGKLADGDGAYALAVGKTGRILEEVWILGAPERLLVVAARAGADALREHLERHLIMEDAEIGPPLDRGVLFAHGPLVAELCDRARSIGADAARIDWTGRDDAAVILAKEGALEETRAALLATAGVALVDDAAWETARIRWGIPRFGVDFDGESLPQEASLEQLAVCFTKGCYLGQETVFMVEKRGHAKKKLVRLAIDPAIDGGDPVLAGVGIVLPDGAEVGVVTSATSATSGGVAALGSVKFKHVGAGTELVVAGRAARVLGPAAERKPARS
jgi:folate-binding protein YgfZ